MLLVSRQAWQAKPPTSISPLPASKVDTVFFHYTAFNGDEQALHTNCPARVRAVQDFHQKSRGWADIAYSFLVCKHGYVFEGRGFGVRTAATGADNDHSLAVCFLGDDTVNRDDLTPLGRRAMVEITQAIERWAGRTLKYQGHRDVMATSCPGDEIHSYIHSPVFASAVRDTGEALRQRTGFYAWAAWRLGEGDWKPYGPRNPSVRPNVPRYILVERPTWFPRLAVMLANRRADPR